MIFVVFRDAGASAVSIMTATNPGRAKYLARTLAARTGQAYHVRRFRADEGQWLRGASYWPAETVPPEASP